MKLKVKITRQTNPNALKDLMKKIKRETRRSALASKTVKKED